MYLLNQKTEGTQLYEIGFTPRGNQKQLAVHVFAKNRLDAHNYMILNHFWGKQHYIVRAATTELIKFGK